MKVELIVTAILLYGCIETKHPEEVGVEKVATVESSNLAPSNYENKLKIFDTIDKNLGFVGQVETKYSLNFLNSDKSQYRKVSFTELSKNSLFEPYAYHVDYYLLWFRCVKIENGYYTVVINESTKDTKLLKIDSDKLKYLTWNELILKSFSVYFDYQSNPIKEKASAQAKPIEYSENEVYFPVEIQGDWLKIKWGSDNNESFGYIRWKKDNKILIDMSYFA